VISFHEGEDRVVKQFIQTNLNRSLKLITKKPLMPTASEIANNVRARSAKMRLIEKI